MVRYLPILLAGAAVLPAPAQPVRELIEGGHWKRARAAVETSKGSDAEQLYLMATVKQAFGDLDAAEKLAERAVAASPKDAQYHYRLGEITGQKAQKAGVFKQIGLARTFKKECEAALAINPDHMEALKDMLQFHLQAPGIVGGDKAKAGAIAEHIMKLDPAQGVQAQIEIARAQKQDNAAIDDIMRKALEMKATTYDMHMLHGNYLAGKKRDAEAEQQARAALHLHPDRATAPALLAMLLARQGKWSEVDTALAQAEKDCPDNFYPYYRVGNFLIESKSDLPRADRYFRKYLSIEPERGFPGAAAGHWRLGLVLELQGRKPDAIAAWQEAVKLDPNSPAKQELKRIK